MVNSVLNADNASAPCNREKSYRSWPRARPRPCASSLGIATHRGCKSQMRKIGLTRDRVHQSIKTRCENVFTILEKCINLTLNAPLQREFKSMQNACIRSFSLLTNPSVTLGHLCTPAPCTGQPSCSNCSQTFSGSSFYHLLTDMQTE
jgi:hypothetical protein